MVGHLQSNKARDAVMLFDLIHSIDTLSTAEKVNQEAALIGKKQKILMQINASREESKSGAHPRSVLELTRKILDLKNLELHGLMTMAPFTDEQALIRTSFKMTQRLMDEINTSLELGLCELSMGMSSDYRIAVGGGATLGRVGAAIFGHRIEE